MFPRGLGGPSYYRRDRPDDAPVWLEGADYRLRSSAGTPTLLVVDEPADLLWLVNRGAIELHFWTARLPEIERPDQLVFDLDPGDAAGFDDVLEAARIAGRELDALNLKSVPKTSGGAGLHLFVPIKPEQNYETVRDWSKAFADRLCARHPALISSASGATHRGERVTIDYAQNSVGKNIAAGYTVRARPGAPVSTPLRWDEVDRGELAPRDFTLRTIRERIARLGDLFEDALSASQTLPSIEA
jgi:bifunctional non-homologous end joining protein LigD